MTREAMDLTLDASVYSGQPLPVEDVIEVLSPFAGHKLEAGPIELRGAYALGPFRGERAVSTAVLSRPGSPT